MSNQNSNKLLGVLLVILIVSIGLNIYNYSKPSEEIKYTDLTPTVDSLKNVITNLESQKDSINTEIGELEDSSGTVIASLANRNKKLKDKEKEYEKKLDSIDRLAADELAVLLSKRYN
jgi:competence protein ComGC